MKIGSIFKDAIILFLITAILGAALSGAKVLTQPAIDKAVVDAKTDAFNQVCEGFSSFENITDDVVGAGAGYNASLSAEEGVLRVKNANDEHIGYIVQCSAKGYGGDLNLIVGFDLDGKILGIAYANTPTETPGIGMKTTEKEFLDSFIGYDTNNVSEVDTISGATITCNGFKQAVSMACMYAGRAKTMDGR